MTMTQADMITLLGEHYGDASRERTRNALNDLFQQIADRLAAGDRVHLPCIGSLVVVGTSARGGIRNPRTGIALPDKPAGRKIKLVEAQAMKERLAAKTVKSPR